MAVTAGQKKLQRPYIHGFCSYPANWLSNAATPVFCKLCMSRLNRPVCTLQVLRHSVFFLLLMLEQDPTKLPDTAVANELRTRQATQALRTILGQMVNECSKPPDSRIPINTQPIQGALISPFSGGRSQEDAEEFLTYLLNAVSDSFSGNFLAPLQSQAWRNPVALMCGSTVQKCKCLSCNCSSSSVETQFFILQIPLPEGSASVFISDLILNECTREEQMTDDNMYDCTKCGVKSDGCRESLIRTAPEILVLQLKRFKFAAEAGQTTKIMTPVNIDSMITLYCTNEETADYLLYSIVMHTGSGPSSGHYFSICRCSGCAANENFSSSSSPNADSVEWRILDDTYVSEQKNTISLHSWSNGKTHESYTIHCVLCPQVIYSLPSMQWKQN